jgi:hypothetical protein
MLGEKKVIDKDNMYMLTFNINETDEIKHAGSDALKQIIQAKGKKSKAKKRVNQLL